MQEPEKSVSEIIDKIDRRTTVAETPKLSFLGREGYVRTKYLFKRKANSKACFELYKNEYQIA